MFERAAPAETFPVQLSLDEAKRIVASHSETVVGWVGTGREGAAQPLTLPDSLLAPSPSSRIDYACNLPALHDCRATVLDRCGRLPDKVGRDLEDDFLDASFPGGQAAVIGPDGERIGVQFRWVCLTSHFSIGAVWRCFIRVGVQPRACWQAVEHDYIFEAGGGVILNPSGEVSLPCPATVNLAIKLIHAEGSLTSFPCSSRRVKITRLCPDGWPRRRVVRLMLHADNRIVALFSDGKHEMVATAASATRAARAA